MRPSRAAILFRDSPPAELEKILRNTLAARRYMHSSEPLPRGYATYVGEWLGFVLTRSDDLRIGVIIPEDISQVFTIALWLAEHEPSLAFCAWRCLQGMDPVLKYYASGKPQLRLGPDRDLEVMWSIPTELPVDIVSPEELGLPGRVDVVEESIGSALEPYKHQIRVLGSQDQSIGFLDRRSPLA
jgi:hypothetical protein